VLSAMGAPELVVNVSVRSCTAHMCNSYPRWTPTARVCQRNQPITLMLGTFKLDGCHNGGKLATQPRQLDTTIQAWQAARMRTPAPPCERRLGGHSCRAWAQRSPLLRQRPAHTRRCWLRAVTRPLTCQIRQRFPRCKAATFVVTIRYHTKERKSHLRDHVEYSTKVLEETRGLTQNSGQEKAEMVEVPEVTWVANVVSLRQVEQLR
jgi:hypothetical protein